MEIPAPLFLSVAQVWLSVSGGRSMRNVCKCIHVKNIYKLNTYTVCDMCLYKLSCFVGNSKGKQQTRHENQKNVT